MKISIVTPNLNKAENLDLAIRSVKDQQIQDLEHIVIDGGSSDRSLEIIFGYDSYLARWISEPDSGPYDAMNKGIEMATGNVIGILNSDDWYEPNVISIIKGIFENDESIDLVHGDMKIWKDKKQIRIQKPREINHNQLRKGMPINHPTCFVRKSTYDKYGLYDISYKICADSEFVFRLWNNNANCFYLPKVITNMSLGGLSDKMKQVSAVESLRIKKIYGMSSPLIYYYYLRGLLRAYLR